MDNNVFNPPKQSRNSLELLKWAIFEPVLLENYSKTLDKKQTVIASLKAYVWIALISLTIYSVNCLFMSIEWILSMFEIFPESSIEYWILETNSLSENFTIFFIDNLVSALKIIIGGIIVSQIIGLTGGLRKNLMLALIISLIGSLPISFIFDLANPDFNWINPLMLSLILGSILSLIEYFTFAFILGLVINLGAYNLSYSFADALILNLGFIIGWYVFYFRIPFYPYHFIKSFFNSKLDKNVYLKDGLIWLLIWGLKNKLFQDAYQRPEIAKQFVNFLLEYRPLQRELAMEILHAATAGEWKANVLKLNHFNAPIYF